MRYRDNVVCFTQEAGSINIFPNGKSQTLTIFLVFLGTSSFFLRILPIWDDKDCCFLLSEILNAKKNIPERSGGAYE
jgi:hypothetical protein